MMYSEYEEWRIKNMHSRPSAIEERQALELAVILDRWQANEIPPEEVLYQTAVAVGSSTGSFISDYSYYRDCATAEGAREHVLRTIREFSHATGQQVSRQDIADQTWSMRQKRQEAIDGIYKILRPEILDEAQRQLIHENIDAIRTRLQNAEFTSWEAAIAIAEVMLPSPPAEALQVDPKIRHFYDDYKNFNAEFLDGLIKEDTDDKCRRYVGIMRDPRYKAFLGLRESIERARSEVGGDANETEHTLDAFEPETEASIKKPLAVLFAKQRAFDTAYQKWVVEKETEYERTHGVSLQQLRAEQKAQKAAAYAAHMAKWPEYEAAEKEKGMVPNDWTKIAYVFKFSDKEFENEHLKKIADEASKHEFRWYASERIEDVDNVDFAVPIDFPGRTLCDKIEITGSGTGLIQIFDKDPDHSWEPTSVARITTYSVVFTPKDPADLELLQKVVEEAVRLLGSIPYKYELPGYTPSGNSYERIAADSENSGYRDAHTTASAYIDAKDGKVSPAAHFDLDDLWTLYYLLEPIIEPNAQIAAAMNAARFTEERGSILKPLDGWGDCGHDVADRSGYLKKSKPKEMLADAMRDAIADYAIEKIDEAGFAARVSALAHHTLAGTIVDPYGNFPTFDTLLETQRSEVTALVTYDEAIKGRTQALLRCLLGEPENSKRPLYVALLAAVREIGEPLKEQSRDHARQERRESRERYYAEQSEKSDADLFAKISKMFNETEFARKFSDVSAGKPIWDDEEGVIPHENELSNPTHLVIASSKVETAIDGIHDAHVTWEWVHFKACEEHDYHDSYESASGTYMTRTKGSPHVRYEMPTSLQPFCPQDSHRPSLRLLLGYGEPSPPK